jgi:hypothetical protein
MQGLSGWTLLECWCVTSEQANQNGKRPDRSLEVRLRCVGRVRRNWVSKHPHLMVREKCKSVGNQVPIHNGNVRVAW